jgi:cation diffusion facilitator family transporter
MLDTSDPGRYRASLHVTWVSVVANVALTAAQIAIGIIGHSQALVADGVHTLSDLITDFMVLYALKHGKKAADEEHPYGHARIETAVTLILGIVLFAVGAGIAVNAGIRLSTATAFVIPSAITLWIAIVTLIAKEALYHYTMRTAQRYNSNMLRANAWHHRSDALSSLIVVAGIGGSLMGFVYLDSIAAVIVALMVAKIGVELSWQALRELIDTGLSAKDLAAIRASILAVNGVKALHLLRTRRIGGRALVDVHIIVDSAIGVSEGHQIGEQVRHKLIAVRDEVADVMVHIDIEDDIQGASTESLPLRDVLSARLDAYFKDIAQARAIEKITLHYIDGRIRVELWLPLATVASTGEAAALARRFRAAVQHDPQIAGLDVAFH